MVSTRPVLPPAPPDLWDRPDMADALARRDIGAVLVIYRKYTGALQGKISAAVDIPQPHISEIIHGRRQVAALEVFERFADGLGIPRHRLGLADRSGAPTPGFIPPQAVAPRTAGVPAEVVRIYRNRGEVPDETWRALLGGARVSVDILVIAGLFLPDGHADLVPVLRGKGAAGTKVRYALGDPVSRSVAIRGDEEGIGENLAARTRLTLTYLSGLKDAAGVDIRLHDTTLYNSIYRFDGEMLVNTHVYGAPAAHSPVLHLRQTPGGSLFEHYAASFERVWTATEEAW